MTISQRLWPFYRLQSLQDSRFSKLSYFSNIWCFCERFFAQNSSNAVVESFLACSCPFQFSSQSDHFQKAIYSLCIGYSLCKMAVFQNRLIFLNICCCCCFFFSSGFLHGTPLIWLQNRFWYVFENFNF